MSAEVHTDPHEHMRAVALDLHGKHEQHRHECEVRLIASWRTESDRPAYARMMGYFLEVSKVRGIECAEKLREDVRTLMQSKGYKLAEPVDVDPVHERVRAARIRTVTEPDLFAEVEQCV